ncbi:NlpC/P60 family protein [Nonomuraea sp. NPDC049152]|uniref:C40 family peptidase n=1 Tax=Nonomuraea sp. NPDC049152 TaxID=3154350 RepID=UPI0033CCA550
MIAELGLAKLLATGGGLVSGIALLAGMAGGAQHAAVTAQPDQRAAAVCAYVPSSDVRPAERIHPTKRLGLTREQSANAKTIIDTAAELGLPERAAVIGIATALQESNLRDGVVGDNGQAHGVFQQHPQHGWGTRAQVTDTAYAARTFYNRLIKVRDWDTRPLTEAAQAVQHSAFPDAYGKHEDRAARILAALDATPQARSTARGRPPSGQPTDVPKLSAHEKKTIQDSIEAAASLGIPKQAVIDDLAAGLRRRTSIDDPDAEPHQQEAAELVATLTKQLCTKLYAALDTVDNLPEEITKQLPAAVGNALTAVRTALSQKGVPYSWGGGGPFGPSNGIGRGAGTKGFDCSGLTEYAWAKAGRGIGSTTYEQVRAGRKVSRSSIQPGDLVFYETDSSRSGPDHVGLAINAKEMVNAPHTGAVVRVDPIDRAGYSIAIRPSPK